MRTLSVIAVFLLVSSLPPLLHSQRSSGTGVAEVNQVLDGGAAIEALPMPVDAILFPAGGSDLLIGIRAGLDYSMHSGAFSLIEDGVVCCTYEEGTGLGFVAGGVAYFSPAPAAPWSISVRLGVVMRRGEFETETGPYPIFGQDNNVEEAMLRDELAAPILLLESSVLYSARLGNTGFEALLGPGVFYQSAGDFTQTESIASPGGVTFADGSTTHERAVDFSGSIEPLLFTVMGGIGYRTEIGSGIYLNPEVLYQYGLTKMTAEDDWKTSAVTATLGILMEI